MASTSHFVFRSRRVGTPGKLAFHGDFVGCWSQEVTRKATLTGRENGQFLCSRQFCFNRVKKVSGESTTHHSPLTTFSTSTSIPLLVVMPVPFAPPPIKRLNWSP